MLTPYDLLKRPEDRFLCSAADAVAAIVDFVATAGSETAAAAATDAAATAAVDAGAVTAGEAAAGEIASSAVAGGLGAGLSAADAAAIASAAGLAGGSALGGLGGAGLSTALGPIQGVGAVPTTAGTTPTAQGTAATAAKPVPGASGSAVGGSTSPSIANAAPGSDIGGPSSGGTFDLKPVDGSGYGSTGGGYQAPGSPYLTFGSDNASNLTTKSGGALSGITDLFGSGSSAAPLGTDLSSSFGSGATGAGAAGAPASKGISGAIADSLGVTSPIGKDVISALPAALPVAYTALQGEQAPKGSNALQSQSQSLSAQGQGLTNYLANGTLPPGIQSALNSAKNSAIAAIKSSYASRGESGSSAEATDIANAEAQIAGQGAGVAMQLFQQGVSEQQISAQIQEGLLSNTIQQDAQFTTALGNFTSALAGGGTPIGTVKLAVG